MLRVQIDNNIINTQPEGLDELAFNIAFDFNLRTILKETESELTFYGDGYDYLYKSFLANSYEGSHTIIIEKNQGSAWVQIWSGLVFIADINIDLGNKSARLRVQDATYDSLIASGVKIEVGLFAQFTKNDEPIDATPTVQTIDLINPPSNTIPAVGLNSGMTNTPIYDCAMFTIIFAYLSQTMRLLFKVITLIILPMLMTLLMP